MNRTTALAIANELIEVLEPVTEKLEIVGELRRGVEDVKRISLLYIPKFGNRCIRIGVTVKVDLAHNELEKLRQRARLTDHVCWGDHVKTTKCAATGITINLTRAAKHTFHGLMVAQTGPLPLIYDIQQRAKAKGFYWDRHSGIFTNAARSQSFCPMSEREVFEFVGIPYVDKNNLFLSCENSQVR